MERDVGKLIKVPGEMTSAAVNHIVAAAIDIYDYDLNKYLSEINSQIKKAYVKPENGIPISDLTNALLTILQEAETALQPEDINVLTLKISALENIIDADNNSIIDKFNEIIEFLKNISSSETLEGLLADITLLLNSKYSKPLNGIPKLDLEESILNSLSKADNALLSENDPTVPSYVKSISQLDILNWNNKLSTAPVTSVNGQTGAVSLALGDTNVIETIKVNNTALTPVSKVVNITVPTKVSDLTNDSNFTSNVGTITGITMNGVSKGTSGVVNLGTVLTEHQDISGKADKSAAIGSLSLSLDSTNYKLTLSGTKVDGTLFTVSNVIDLPLESVVVSGSYDSQTKKVILTLQDGSTIDFSVADLVAGLQSEITVQNPLSADLIIDGSTNKVVTGTDKTNWNAKYDLPSGGIPKTDLSSAVQTSLGKADTALQPADMVEFTNNEVDAIWALAMA